MKHLEVIPGIAMMLAASLMAADQVHVDTGIVQGTASADGTIRIFKGIPYAAPPVGDLRWKPPQPVTPWEGVRQTTDFAPRCEQGRIYDDMVFRDKGPSEDCLYLNVWAPRREPDESPSPSWCGFTAAGSWPERTSEPRQDGENLAHKGVIVVSMNYRLGVFGFFAHPELTRESDHTRVGQLRPARSGRRAPVGAPQHRRVRRRSEQRDDLRRIGRVHVGQRPDGHAAHRSPDRKRPSAKAAPSSERCQLCRA